MMSEAHIAAGAAAALLFAQDGSPESCAAAVVGGAIGGVIADCDAKSSRARKNAFLGRVMVVGMAAAAAVIDRCTGAGLWDAIVSQLGARTVAGMALLAALTFAGARTEHRSFTHSVAGMASFCASAWLAFPALSSFFAAGYASHLALDLANRKGVRLLWPAKAEFSLGLCRADGLANAVVAAAGFALAGLLAALDLGMAAAA